GVTPVAHIGNFNSLQSLTSLIIPSVISPFTPRHSAIADITPPQQAVVGFAFPATIIISPGFAISIAFKIKISSPALEFTVMAEPTNRGVGFQTGFIL